MGVSTMDNKANLLKDKLSAGTTHYDVVYDRHVLRLKNPDGLEAVEYIEKLEREADKQRVLVELLSDMVQEYHKILGEHS